LREGGGDHIAGEGAAFVTGDVASGVLFLAGAPGEDGVVVDSWRGCQHRELMNIYLEIGRCSSACSIQGYQ